MEDIDAAGSLNGYGRSLGRGRTVALADTHRRFGSGPSTARSRGQRGTVLLPVGHVELYLVVRDVLARRPASLRSRERRAGRQRASPAYLLDARSERP